MLGAQYASNCRFINRGKIHVHQLELTSSEVPPGACLAGSAVPSWRTSCSNLPLSEAPITSPARSHVSAPFF